jgi:hypothetical protein
MRVLKHDKDMLIFVNSKWSQIQIKKEQLVQVEA